MTDRKPQNQDKFILRMPDGMRDRIKSVAEKNNRSMNSEILSTLSAAYPEPATLVADMSLEEVIELVASDGLPRQLKKGKSVTTVVMEADGSIQATSQYTSGIVTLKAN
ncbi:Arc family DNA-binding protein [Pseudoprimorskyibacter insulae]|uniref:Arc family DNA-binding protein n=1 Tax=Pseudoprimorskyibacter insulae TaxID=1695997 RepID=UPI000D562846|nr:Arc family DNA-binding protein [Pseudoprimorskyibacter insulae]